MTEEVDAVLDAAAEIAVTEGAEGQVTTATRPAAAVSVAARPAGAVAALLRSAGAVDVAQRPEGVATASTPPTVGVGIIGLPGPEGPEGPMGPAGPPGSNGTGATYRHVQMVAATVWTIAHNLGYWGNVTAVDSTGREVVGEVDYPDVNTIVLTFSAPVGGEAYVS